MSEGPGFCQQNPQFEAACALSTEIVSTWFVGVGDWGVGKLVLRFSRYYMLLFCVSFILSPIGSPKSFYGGSILFVDEACVDG